MKQLQNTVVALLLLAATSFTAQAQYTLQDADVTVTAGIITAATAGNVADYAGNTSNLTSIIIPDMLDGQTVTGIGDIAFQSRGITAITLPTSILTISTQAFFFNPIVSLDLSGLTALTTIGINAFRSNSLTSLNLSGLTALTTIDESAFASNNLANVDLSGLTALTSIKGYAFFGNPLTSFTLPTPNIFGSDFDFWLKDGVSLGVGVFLADDVTASYFAAFTPTLYYTLQDADVTVTAGIITAATAGNVADYAANTDKLANIIIPDMLDGQTITGIGSYVFLNKGISSVNLSSLTSLSSIGESAFRNNNLTSINLSGLTSLIFIEQLAFADNNLPGFTLPTPNIFGSQFNFWRKDGVSLGAGIFLADDVTAEYAADLTPTLFYTLQDADVTVVGGIITAATAGNVADYTANTDKLSNIIIPDMLDGQTITGIINTSFGSGIFENKNITSIDFNGLTALTYIGNFAFYNNNLTNIDLSSLASLTAIGENAFSDNSLNSLDLSGLTALTTIGVSAFRFNNLISIDLSGLTSLISIGQVSFSDNNLTSLDLSGLTALTTIGGYAFRFNSLATINLSGLTALTTIEQSAFSNNNLANIDLSGLTALTTIADYTFFGNPLTSFTLPTPNIFGSTFNFWRKNGVSLGVGVFLADDVTAEYAADLSPILYYTLQDDDVTVTAGIITAATAGNVADYTANTDKLTNIIIPDLLDGQTITGIGSYVFFNKGITGVNLSGLISLTSIDQGAFQTNTIASLDFSGNTALTSIGDYAFNANSLTGIMLPASLQVIGKFAFRVNFLVSIDLSGNTALTSIGEAAFDNNTLTGFTLPIVTGSELFGWKDGNGNTYLGGDLVTDPATFYYVPEPYTLTDDDVVVTGGIIESCSYTFALTDIIIPDILDGQTVTGIANSVFANKGITDIVLPTSIQSIGDYAFYSNSIVSLDLTAFTVLTAIAEEAFSANPLISLALPASLQTIGIRAFYNNSLTSINLSGNTALTSIGEAAFDYFGSSPSNFTLPTPNIPGFDFNYWEKDGVSLGVGVSLADDLSASYSAKLTAVDYILQDDDVTVTAGIITAAIAGNVADYVGNVGNSTNIIIPEILDGQTVTGIDALVFDSKGITEVLFDAKLLSIGAGAFDNNISLAGFILPTPAFDIGYMLNWSDDATPSNTYVGGATVADLSLAYTANITLINYTITYNLDGGANGANPATYTVEDAVITLASATKSGFTFGGWYNEEAFTNAVTEIAAGSTGDVELFAKFTAIDYTITYNLDGGTNDAANPATYTAENAITLADATKAGFTFGGWFSDAELTTSVIEIATGSTGDVELYAKFTAIAYSITYNLDGGTNATGNPASYTVEDATITLAAATKAGFTFGGWFSDAEFTTAVIEIATGSTGDVELYAKFTAIDYTITYNLDGGTNATGNPASYTVEDATITLAAATQTGYTFGGWYSEAAFTTEVPEIATGSTGDINLFAKFEILLGIDDKLTLGIALYPNPASTTINLTFANKSTLGYARVLNLSGKTLSTHPITAGATKLSIDVSRLSNGIYIIAVNTALGVSTHRFVKQ